MIEKASLLRALALLVLAVAATALENPSPNDWLMFSRTYDAQRFSPLEQINRQNVTQLRLAWERGMGPGQTESDAVSL
jgi:glucose dehydrogenase